MKYKWRITWSDGTVDTAVYAVSRELAERAARKWAHEGCLYNSPNGEPLKIELIPEK